MMRVQPLLGRKLEGLSVHQMCRQAERCCFLFRGYPLQLEAHEIGQCSCTKPGSSFKVAILDAVNAGLTRVHRRSENARRQVIPDTPTPDKHAQTPAIQSRVSFSFLPAQITS